MFGIPRWVVVLVGLLLGVLVYRLFFTSELNVTPDAAREIEKAKRR